MKTDYKFFKLTFPDADFQIVAARNLEEAQTWYAEGGFDCFELTGEEHWQQMTEDEVKSLKVHLDDYDESEEMIVTLLDVVGDAAIKDGDPHVVCSNF